MNDQDQKEKEKYELRRYLYEKLTNGHNTFTDFWVLYGVILLTGGVFLILKLRQITNEGFLVFLIAFLYIGFGTAFFSLFEKIKERIIVHYRAKRFPEDYQLILDLNQGLKTISPLQKKQLLSIFSRFNNQYFAEQIKNCFQKVVKTWSLEIITEMLTHIDISNKEEILDSNIYFQELISMLKGTNDNSILEKYSDSEFTAIRETIASNPAMGSNLEVKLSFDRSNVVLKALAKNPKASLETLLRIATNSPGDTRQTALKTPKMIEYLHEAGNTNSINLITKLAESELEEVREKIAANPNTPPSILMKFNKDTLKVKMQMAKNPGTPEYFLGDLANKDSVEELKYAVKENPLVIKQVNAAKTSNDPKELESLSTKPFTGVREQVALNEFTPVETLQKLSIDMAMEVQTAIAQNPKTPYELVSQFLSKLTKGEVETSEIIGYSETRVDDHDGYRIDKDPIFKTREIYTEETVNLAKKLLAYHPQDKQQKIMEKLKELNSELHTAIITALK